MNERILKFAASHFPRDGEGNICATPEIIAEFAELIVKECAKKIQIHKTRIQANAEYMRGHNDACDDAVSIIKKHFGVEL